MTQRSETLQFLAVSPHRVEILRTLRDAGQLRRSELTATSRASHRTVKRALAAFRERGWVQETDRRLRLTVGGAFVLDAYEDFADRASLVDDLRPFFANVAEEDCYAGPEAFEDATIIETDPGSPFAPVEYLLERYREATDHASVLLTYVSASLLDRVVAEERPEGLDVTIVVDDCVQSAIERNGEYAGLLEERATTAEVFALDETFPFTCAIVDDHAVITITDEDGFPSVVLGSTNPALRTVLEGRFRDALERARPL